MSVKAIGSPDTGPAGALTRLSVVLTVSTLPTRAVAGAFRADRLVVASVATPVSVLVCGADSLLALSVTVSVPVMGLPAAAGAKAVVRRHVPPGASVVVQGLPWFGNCGS